MRILALGLPFQMANMAFTAIIRSDGNPKYTMRSMMIGAGINLVLDPIFIFGLDMGVTGAAIATIIGQVVAGLICVASIPRFEHITFYKKSETVRQDLRQYPFSGFPQFLYADGNSTDANRHE